MTPATESTLEKGQPASLVCGDLFGITPQTQPTPSTCVQTCVAMVLSVPVAEVIARYGDGPMNQQLMCNVLTQCGVVWNQMTQGTMVHEGWYLATVPSLNNRGGNHQILVRFTSHDGVCVVDPAIGQRYKQDGSDLRSWSYLTPLWLGGSLPNTPVSHGPEREARRDVALWRLVGPLFSTCETSSSLTQS